MWRWDKNSLVIKKNGTFVEKGKNCLFIYFYFFLKEEVVLVLDN